MSQISSVFANLPGITSAVESFENQVTFGIAAQLKWWSAYIASTTSDPTNSPTWRLRPGLVMGKITASGQWTNYSATATDGSEVAAAVLGVGIRMQDVITGSNTSKFYAICTGGNVRAGNLYGLDGQARIAMAPNFTFDDTVGNNWQGFADWPRYQIKTADYTIVAADNFSMFTTFGGTGAVNFTLPAIANGYRFGFNNQADQNLTVTSAEGANMIALNSLVANSVAFSSGGAKVGGTFVVYSNVAGTKWIVETRSAGANTVTVA